jgi:serine/threonine-protein kinase
MPVPPDDQQKKSDQPVLEQDSLVLADKTQAESSDITRPSIQPPAHNRSAAGNPETQQATATEEYNEAAPDRLIGQVLADKYLLQSRLGSGGMSVVYKAEHIYMKKTVAIKVMHSHLLTDGRVLPRFRQESQATSTLDHENILRVYDFGVTASGVPFLVMDYLPGQSLDQVIETTGPLKLNQFFAIMTQIVAALAHAHKRGIIHRDLKPSNIILVRNEDGSPLVKLVDFGIAKLLAADDGNMPKLTQTGEIFGSPAYMSPEQCMGSPIDARSDIYSLGCVMYECVSGKTPFTSGTVYDLIFKQINDQPPPLNCPDNQALATAVEPIVLKCMAKDPAQRQQSMEEVLAELQDSAKPPPSGLLSKMRSMLSVGKLRAATKSRTPRSPARLAAVTASLSIFSAAALSCAALETYTSHQAADTSQRAGTLAKKLIDELNATDEQLGIKEGVPEVADVKTFANTQAHIDRDYKLLESMLPHDDSLETAIAANHKLATKYLTEASNILKVHATSLKIDDMVDTSTKLQALRKKRATPILASLGHELTTLEERTFAARATASLWQSIAGVSLFALVVFGIWFARVLPAWTKQKAQ